MSDIPVRIVELKPMRVASAYGYGETPELTAWERILKWAENKGLLEKREAVRFFGFNNPDPTPGTPNYGYEQWITIPVGIEGDDNVTIKDFMGGLYAVTECQSLSVIGELWKALVAWREDSVYQEAHHQWLEELLSPPGVPVEEYIFDLFLPIAE